MDDTFQVHLLCRHQGEALRKVKPHLVAEHADGARTRAVAFLMTVVKDILQ